MAQKISRLLLLTLIFSLGFGQLLRFELWGVPLYFHDLMVIALLILQGQGLKDIILLPGLKIFVVGLALGWLSALLRYPLVQLLIPSLYTIRLLAYLLLFLILSRKSYNLSRSYFLLSGLITLAIGYLQYFLLPDMRVFQYLGWDDHWNRLTLPHFDPTFTGVILVMVVLSLYPRFHYWTLLFFPAILLTMARSVWLTMGLVGLAYGVQYRRWGKLLLAIILFSCYLFFRPVRFGEGHNLLRTYSITSRLGTDWSYVQQYKWDLLLGRGLNTLMLDQPTRLSPNHATGPNNSYLYLLLTTGILGLFGWMRFLLSLARSSHSPYLVLFFALAALFNNVMFYPFALLWILLFHSKVPTST